MGSIVIFVSISFFEAWIVRSSPYKGKKPGAFQKKRKFYRGNQGLLGCWIKSRQACEAIHGQPRIADSRSRTQSPSRLPAQRNACCRYDYGQPCSLNRWIQTALSNSKNAVGLSSARTTNRLKCGSDKALKRSTLAPGTPASRFSRNGPGKMLHVVAIFAHPSHRTLLF